MASDQPLQGPDLAQGISSAELPEGGKLVGHAAGEAVLLVRAGGAAHAIGATCTHLRSRSLSGEGKP